MRRSEERAGSPFGSSLAPATGREKKLWRWRRGSPPVEEKKRISKREGLLFFRLGGRLEKRKNVMAECVGL